jgi:hypothetical protein
MSRRDLLKMGAASLIATTGLKAELALAGGTANPLGFCPTKGIPGDIIELFGPDLGTRPDDVMIKLGSGRSFAFLRALGFSDSGLLAEFRSVRPGTFSGQIEAVMGMGTRLQPINLPEEIALVEPIYAWLGNGGARYTTFQSFEFLGNVPFSCTNNWNERESPDIRIDFPLPYNEDCCPILPSGRLVSMRCYGSSSENGGFEFAFEASFISRVAMSSETLGKTLCDLLIRTFEAEFGITMNCVNSPFGENRVRFYILTPTFTVFGFDSGSMQVDTQPFPRAGDPGSITSDLSLPSSLTFNNPCDVSRTFDTNCQSLSVEPDCSVPSFTIQPFIFA